MPSLLWFCPYLRPPCCILIAWTTTVVIATLLPDWQSHWARLEVEKVCCHLSPKVEVIRIDFVCRTHVMMRYGIFGFGGVGTILLLCDVESESTDHNFVEHSLSLSGLIIYMVIILLSFVLVVMYGLNHPNWLNPWTAQCANSEQRHRNQWRQKVP
ncbi:hypothetical protein BGY98DRAFT_232453 [Russula aff. rugulosa BPL654]|nr:hypothetical protein BGY98DRAFT_232453 [Russula aff. rugulosa BPL654]